LIIIGSCVAVFLVAAAAVLALVRADRPSSPAATSAVTTTASAVKVATIGQYAGLVNEVRVDIRNTWDRYYLPCLIGEEKSFRCSIGPLTLRTEANIPDGRCRGDR
jgi:hypothetical protein